jgi:hypothetical protein
MWRWKSTGIDLSWSNTCMDEFHSTWLLRRINVGVCMEHELRTWAFFDCANWPNIWDSSAVSMIGLFSAIFVDCGLFASEQMLMEPIRTFEMCYTLSEWYSPFSHCVAVWKCFSYQRKGMEFNHVLWRWGNCMEISSSDKLVRFINKDIIREPCASYHIILRFWHGYCPGGADADGFEIPSLDAGRPVEPSRKERTQSEETYRPSYQRVKT